METTFIIVTTVTILMNTGIAIADFARAPFVLANSAEVGVPQSWLPALGAAKGAGALGLAAGFAWPPVGIAAAVGLVLFYCGAIFAHLRAGVFYNLAFPAAFLAFAAGTLTLGCVRL
ncbi:DoxX family protein [Mycolicibacterium holsaticum]|jgi:hypothetical protein|uniref:Transmembrane invasion protein n=1 Tax=Mycolicibacterium holsaticum TaxID=152142 RepID=A0A1E3R4D0_9MYCO|nr:DoxX family protein [Mycolicibacterium holsaticum]ODQ84785.1 hypothetical protein BHQ17_25880 [Mycolicibacterium holsaticum]